MAAWSYSLLIEGVGNDDGQYRLCTHPVSFDVLNLYRTCMTLYPQEVSAEVDIRGGSSSIGGLDCTLIHLSAEGDDIGRMLLTSIPRKVGAHTGTLTRTSTTIATDVDDGSLANTMVMLSREAIWIGAHGGFGVYACVRARMGTTAKEHSSGVNDDVSLFDASRLVHPLDRRVELRRAPSNGKTYNAEETVWAGVLADLSEPTPGAIRVDAESTLSLLREQQIGRNLWRGSLLQPPNAETGALALYGGSGSPMQSTPYISLEGKTCARPTSVFGGSETQVRIAQSDIIPNCPPLDSARSAGWVAEVLRCDGSPTTSTNQLPLSRNKITLALQLLTSTAFGDNGDFDTGVEDVGCGVPVEYIDVETFLDVRASFGDELNDDNRFLFVDNQPIDVLDFLDSILHPHGIIITSSLDGRITLFQFKDSGTPTVTLTEEEFLHDPTISQSPRLDSATDIVEVVWDGLPGVPPRKSTFRDVLATERKQRAANNGESLDLSAVAIESKARRVAIARQQRFRNALPHLDGATTRFKDLDIGDLVAVTHTRVRNPTTGKRGVTGALFQCTSRRAIFREGRIKFRLVYVGAIYARTGLIAPSAQVASYNAGTNTLTVESNAFQSGNHPDYPTDADGFEAGVLVDIRDSRLAPIHDNIVLIGRAGNELYLGATGLTPAPKAGDIVVFSSHDVQSEAVNNKWASLNGNSSPIDPPYQWTV